MSGLNHLRLVARGTRLRPGVELELELRRRSAYRLSELVRRKGDDTHSNKLRQYYGTTFLRHNIARLS